MGDLKMVTDHGWPVAWTGDDEHAFDAFKNERDHIAKVGRDKTTIAAMDWAVRTIARLEKEKAELMEALKDIMFFVDAGQDPPSGQRRVPIQTLWAARAALAKARAGGGE